MTLYIGIDDTDVIDSRGTGHLARLIADDLSANYAVIGVIRHQLLFDAHIPYTAKNSSASILLDANSDALDALFERVKNFMLANFIVGSDPGLAIAANAQQDIINFGNQAKTDIVTQSTARTLAEKHNIRLAGLGGTNGGIIGALASLGLAASGNDGRYIRVGTIRDLTGLQSIASLQAAGINSVKTLDGQIVNSGLVLADKLRPSRRNHHPVLFVEATPDGHWLPLKLD
ncbi:MAG: ABC transporter substrate-binding protein [Anaerolineae bacterium]|nr:ABC transporter substrate-binding protein [Anaerolineae bacterium]